MCCGFDCCCCGGDSERYIQCRLKKIDSEQVAWIPQEFAVVGKMLKIRGDNGEMENGWVVQSAGANNFSGDDLDRITESQMNIVYKWSKRDELIRHLQARIDNRYAKPRQHRK